MDSSILLSVFVSTRYDKGLKEYIGANPSLRSESSTQFVHSTLSDVSSSSSEYKDAEAADEFYDAIAADLSSDDEDSDNEEIDSKDKKVKLKNISWTIASLALKRTSAPDLSEELDPNVPAIILDPSQYCGSMCQEKDEADSNCWTSPRGKGFMIRGKTYLKDCSKVMGGDPLLKLIAVDWFKVENCISKVALHPSSLVQNQPRLIWVCVKLNVCEVKGKVLQYHACSSFYSSTVLSKAQNGARLGARRGAALLCASPDARRGDLEKAQKGARHLKRCDGAWRGKRRVI
ncbi:similar to ENHANCED DISEASE RESISTANCE protein [Actinidia rufa]|uniref:Similar to ENHANCED DISEASE RESISTANCE protein n=1 Tax=Actinidia rufa TaxID=165716 RepID=A0A7J0DSS5_9ERIC|nr:similar to ENHANCED DISEASE RESISTANCE protein [Actinidia rufa]